MTSTRMTRDQLDSIDDMADTIMDLDHETMLTIINNARQFLTAAELDHLRFRLPMITF